MRRLLCSFLLTCLATKAAAVGCGPCYWEDANGACSWVGGPTCGSATSNKDKPKDASLPQGPNSPPPPPPPPLPSIQKSNLPKQTGSPPQNGEPQPGDPNHIDDFGAVSVGVKPAAEPRAEGFSAKASAEASLREAQSALLRGSYGWAIQAATSSIRQYPGNPGAFGLRAQAANLLGNYPQAEQDAAAAIRLSPNAAAYQNLAWAQLRLHKLDDALKSAEEAKKLNPGSGLGYAILAAVKDAKGDRQGALWNIRQAAKLDPGFEKNRELADAGGLIYDPNGGDSLLLARALAPERVPESRPWERWLEGLAAAAAAGVTLFLIGRRRKTGSWKVALTPLPSVPVDSKTPGDAWVGKYELGRVVGRGGMGVVYEAVDHALGRTVAIKKMSDTLGAQGEKWRQTYIQEARTVASLHHPAIVDIYDIVEQDETIYLVFEFVQGKTAHQILAAEGRFPLYKVLAVLRPVCEALEFAHAKGRVHRDLKPMNIMITEDGRAKLMDFGIARLLTNGVDGKPDINQTQNVLGTPLYMAPECWQGVVRKESDIFSLGVCLYEMLTGALPVARYEPPSAKVAGMPSKIDELVAQALEPNPDKRIKSAKDFLNRLKAAANVPLDTPV